MVLPASADGRTTERSRRVAVDGWITGGEMWVVMSRPGDGLEDLLGADEARGGPVRLCRRVLRGGMVLLGDADADRDPRLSELMRGRSGREPS